MYDFLPQAAKLFAACTWMLILISIGYKQGMDAENPEKEIWFYRVGALVFFALLVLVNMLISK